VSQSSPVHRFLLRVWRDVPFPDWLRVLFLRILNPSFMAGAMALVQDEQGRILLLLHTYRREMPWGLPGGWLKHAESPEAGLAREVFEETGFHVIVDDLLVADFWDRSQIDLLYRCHVVGGAYQATDETSSHRWVSADALPSLLPNQVHLLRRAGILPPA
jgi:8-oxo-dGTP pyrophosphatase MutT (NUDIX family)